MPLTREKLHSMGKDSESGEKLRIRGKGNGATGRNRQHRVRGKRTNQRTCAWCRERRECHEKCREAGGDVDTVSCLFPSEETRSSAVKRKGKEDWRSQKCARSSHGLNA